jgi:hypothetical protein
LLKHTIDIDVSSPVADKSIGCLEKIVHANAQSNFLNDLPGSTRKNREGEVYLVCIFLVDLVLNFVSTPLVELMRRYLDQV